MHYVTKNYYLESIAMKLCDLTFMRTKIYSHESFKRNVLSQDKKRELIIFICVESTFNAMKQIT